MSRKILSVIPVVLIIGVFMSVFCLNTDVAAVNEAPLRVYVKENLSVSVATPTTWASGSIDTFLRNKIHLSVSTNNVNGFVASMSAPNSSLVNTTVTSNTIPTLSSNVLRSGFSTNMWGYSLGSGHIDTTLNNKTYGETEAGNNSSRYHPIPSTSTPDVILNNSSNTVGEQDIYFGTKVDISKLSGTYAGTVIINVVTGTIDSDNPITPVNPAVPTQDNTAVYDAPSDRTIYTTTTTTSTTRTQTTEVSDGNVVDSYAPAQGVINNTSSNIYEGSMLTTALVATTTVTAGAGIFFFILAKRKKEEEEEEEEDGSAESK